MSNTKGSMLISNANAVGTELVNQLGGTGYKPSEWADAINLLGISDDDKASALAGITEGTYTGTERGAIKYSNCNAIGAMLNKKFSTNRGFKPVEWESAISKLTPLAEGTVSGAICNIVNGAEDVPLKNWQVTLPASLDGYTEVNGVKSGANLFNEDWEVGGINDTTGLPNSDTNKIRSKSFSIIKGGTTCYVSVPQPIRVLFYTSAESFISETANIRNNSFSVPANCSLFKIRGTVDYGTTYNNDIMISYGSTATAYDAYEAPTQYTASLGRTIYGGTADIVTGEGSETNAKQTFTGGETWTWHSNGFWYTSKPENNIASTRYYTCSNGVDISYNPNGQIRCYASRNVGVVDDQTDMNALMDNTTAFVYDLDHAETFTFTPITADTALGVSNWWSDNGDSTITYRKDPDIPDPPVQLLNMNNNNDNNEGV